jgi:hypothetical protein
MDAQVNFPGGVVKHLTEKNSYLKRLKSSQYLAGCLFVPFV